ncbi:MAG TPA: hypothetical protein VFM34_13605, partial [Moraxellaceae bacterium]|nr:hypothetical protein [Moraxellaceae bacterium]
MQFLTAFWHELTARPDFWGFISIPVVAAVVTWVHVWWAMRMVFYPLDFIGIKTPQLERAIGLHPFGWQGIIPRKARKMSDIVVDRVIHKMGSVSDFLRQMEPEKVAAYVSASVSGNIEAYTDDVMRERNSLFWDNLPVTIKQRIYSHVRSHLPRIMDGVVRAMIEHIDDLVDVKEMCGRQMENDKALVVRMFLEVGDREVKFIINASFWIGLAFGLVQMVLFWFIPWHGLLPLYAAVLGCLTNWLALAMVFRPVDPVNVGPFTIQGLFLRRQAAVADKFAELSSREILTVEQFMREVLTGKHSSRAKRLIKRHVDRLVDESILARTGAQVAFGPSGFANLKSLITDKSVDMALKPLANERFNRERAAELASLFAGKMKEMTPAE